MSAADTEQAEFVSLTAAIVSAYLSHNHVQPGDLPSLIQGFVRLGCTRSR